MGLEAASRSPARHPILGLEAASRSGEASHFGVRGSLLVLVVVGFGCLLFLERGRQGLGVVFQISW